MEVADKVRKAAPDDLPLISTALSCPFFDDPLFAWALPDADRRQRLLPEFFALFTRAFLRHPPELHQQWRRGRRRPVGAARWGPGRRRGRGAALLLRDDGTPSLRLPADTQVSSWDRRPSAPGRLSSMAYQPGASTVGRR